MERACRAEAFARISLLLCSSMASLCPPALTGAPLMRLRNGIAAEQDEGLRVTASRVPHFLISSPDSAPSNKLNSSLEATAHAVAPRNASNYIFACPPVTIMTATPTALSPFDSKPRLPSSSSSSSLVLSAFWHTCS